MISSGTTIERKSFSEVGKNALRSDAFSRWKHFAGWLGLAFVGQVASLQMIDAGRSIHFQHYKTLAQIADENLWSLILCLVQIVCVAAFVRRRREEAKKWVGENLKTRRLFALVLFLFFAGAAVTPNLEIYATSLGLAAVVQSVNLANAVLLGFSIPPDALDFLSRKVEKFFGGAKSFEKPRLDKFSALAALWIVLLAAALSNFVYQNHPHVPDEVQYLFQAKYMAAGRLTVDAPPVPEAFSMYMIPTDEPRWFSIFPPGWSALLAAGEKLSAVWLVNPLMAGICVLLGYLFFQEICDIKFARLAVALLCFSPWFVFMAMSFMSHILTLACALGAAVALQGAFRTQKKSRVFAAGLLVGILSLTRPLDAVVISVLLGVWTLIKFKNPGTKIFNAAIFGTGILTTAWLILPYNKAVTGDALRSPMDFYYTKYFWSGVMSLGFGANRGIHWELDAFPGHSPLEALINACLNIFSLNTELFGWACGSLILICLFLFGGRLRKKDFWAIAVIVSTAGAYSLFWYHGGPDFGARYWFLMIVPLIALTVRGAEFLSRKIDGSNNESTLNPRVVFVILAVCVMSFINYLPWRAADKYFHYLEMQPDVRQLARDKDFGRSLVLIRGAEYPDYASTWIYNPLDFKGDAPVYALDKSPAVRERLLESYADRPVWIVDAPSRTGGGYKISRGPASAAQLLAEIQKQNFAQGNKDE